MLYLSKNPFRVISISSNSGQKIIQKNLSKLKAFSKIGKSKEFDYDLSFLNLAPIDRSFDIISKVESRILLDENKLKYSLFWFQDVSSFDSIALANLIKGDSDKALEIWAKTMKSGEVNSKNFSAFNNTSTLLLFLQLESSKTDQFKNDSVSISKLKQALDQKIKLIKSDYFVEYCLSIGVKSEINTTEIQKFLTETMLEILNQNFTNKQLLELVSGLDADLSESINSSLVKEPISNIKEQLKISAAALKDNVKEGLVIGKILIKNTVSDIRYLKETLGVEHYNYESLAGNLSNQILQCGINYFNETGDDQSYLSSYKYALSIAPNEKIKSRAKDTIKHCEEEKEANICSCCSVSPIYKNSSHNLTIYKETKRTYFPQRVEYSHGTLNLFFCKPCLAKVTEKDSRSQIITWVIAIIATIVVGIASEHIGAAVIGGAIGLALGSFIGGLFSADNSSIIRNHPNTKKYLNQGYQLNQPTA